MPFPGLKICFAGCRPRQRRRQSSQWWLGCSTTPTNLPPTRSISHSTKSSSPRCGWTLILTPFYRTWHNWTAVESQLALDSIEPRSCPPLFTPFSTQDAGAVMLNNATVAATAGVTVSSYSPSTFLYAWGTNETFADQKSARLAFFASLAKVTSYPTPI